jgi:hypothetical protein
MSSTILRQAAQGRQWVSRKRLSTFAGTCVSLTLAMPFARFYTRSLCDDMRSYKLKTQSNHAAARNGERMRICHQCVRDLKTWRKLTASEKLGRSMHPQAPDGIMHTDAADVGYCGTLGITGNPGDAGLWESQGAWGWKDRAKCISECELRAVPLLLQGRLGQKTRQAGNDHDQDVRRQHRSCCGDQRFCVIFARNHAGVAQVKTSSRPRGSANCNRVASQCSKLICGRAVTPASYRRRPDPRAAHALRRGWNSSADRYFPNKRTLGEHPVYTRKRALEELTHP